jgi:hypothetical protein
MVPVVIKVRTCRERAADRDALRSFCTWMPPPSCGGPRHSGETLARDPAYHPRDDRRCIDLGAACGFLRGAPRPPRPLLPRGFAAPTSPADPTSPAATPRHTSSDVAFIRLTRNGARGHGIESRVDLFSSDSIRLWVGKWRKNTMSTRATASRFAIFAASVFLCGCGWSARCASRPF